MLVCVSGDILGTPGCVTYDGSRFSNVDVPPGDAWVLGTSGGIGNIADLLALESKSFDASPPQRFAAPFEQQLEADKLRHVPWSMAMPRSAFKSYVSSTLRHLHEEVSAAATGYYLQTFKRGSSVIQGLDRAKIDRFGLMREMTTGSHATSAALPSFVPGQDGFAERTEYDRTKTRTGRLVVRSGPQILTLPKECRSIIVPREENGSIWSLDFVSFEAQIILALLGRQPRQDVYADIVECVFNGEMSRSHAKLATLSLLYGMGRSTLAEQLETTERRAEAIAAEVKKYFEFDRVMEIVNASINGDVLSNKYGRHVKLDGAKGHLALSYYVQSTAVDAALLGFTNSLDVMGSIRPIFLIHDSIVLDVPAGQEHRVGDVAAAAGRIAGFEGLAFPVRTERMK